MKRLVFTIVVLAMISCSGTGDGDRITREEFLNPPAEYSLDIWWHWPNGNISREAIRKDLISMHENGIKRATILNVLGSGQFVERVNYATEEWFDMFRYALDVADSLGMRIGVHNCDGWSTSGGPWITADMSIKTYTWSNVWVNGGKEVDIMLPEPTSNNDYYVDYAVIAFPQHRKVNTYIASAPEVEFNGAPVGDLFNDNNPKSQIEFAQGDRMTIAFGEPFTVREVAMFRYCVFSWSDMEQFTCRFKLSMSDDGSNFKPVGELTFKGANCIMRCSTKPLTARYFQLESIDPGVQISEVELLPGNEESEYSHDFTNYLPRTYNTKNISATAYGLDLAENAEFIPEESVIDLSDKMAPDGRLSWNAPQGEWCIVRFGYTTTGITNYPATDEGRGFESDKMDAAATELHFNHLPKKLVEAAGAHNGRTFQFILIDSWECRFPNWTAAFPEEFEKASGYSIKTWIPVLLGYPVGDKEKSQAFVHDYDRTIASLIDRNYYRKIADMVHKSSLEIHSEPIYGNASYYPPLDVLRANSYCDLPMTEFWAKSGPDKQPAYEVDDRYFEGFPIDAALTAGKKVIGAEAYTGYANFSELPQMLKPYGDNVYCSGVNQFILHSYVLQPLDRSTHMTLMESFGGHFNKNSPWWNFAKDWSLYHARVQYMLQKGEPVIDALYYIGDQYPQNFPYHMLETDLPRGYRANSCNFDYLDKIKEAGFRRIIIPQGVLIEERTATKLEDLKASGIEVYYAEEGVSIPFDTTPDFSVSSSDEHFKFIHKKLDGQDIYFVFNQEDRSVCSDFLFRVSGKEPEVWNPENGTSFAPAVWQNTTDGRSSIRLTFKPHQSLFVVFSAESSAQKEMSESGRASVDGLKVRMDFEPFYEKTIAPVETDCLKSLTEFEDEDIRFFGGYVRYTIEFDVPAKFTEARATAINLGSIGGVAEVRLNGKTVRYLWKDDDDIPVDNLLWKGNRLEVILGTTLRNRMAGDMEKYGRPVNVKTPTSVDRLPQGEKDLKPSGLMGPVSVIMYK